MPPSFSIKQDSSTISNQSLINAINSLKNNNANNTNNVYVFDDDSKLAQSQISKNNKYNFVNKIYNDTIKLPPINILDKGLEINVINSLSNMNELTILTNGFNFLNLSNSNSTTLVYQSSCKLVVLTNPSIGWYIV